MTPKRGETGFLPWEQAAARPDIQILLEDKQIALVRWNPGPLPPGGCAVGLELTTSEVMIIMAVPTEEDPVYKYRLFFRWIPAQRIWTKRMDRRSRFGRIVIPGEPAADFLQRQIEGEVIRGCLQIREPNSGGGEQSMIELRNGNVLHFNALPDPRGTKHRSAAELDLEVKSAVEKLIFLPTSQS